MRILFALMISALLISSCKKEKIDCIEGEEITQFTDSFMVKINNRRWTPNFGAICYVHKNVLNVFARDTLIEGKWYLLNFEVYNPTIGRNAIGSISFTEFESHTGYTYGEVNERNGEIYITTLDTINGSLEATFNYDILTDDGTISLTQGTINMSKTKLYCEVSADTIDSTTDLYNHWVVIGFKKDPSSKFDFPPCHTTPFIQFESLDEDSILNLNGKGTVNKFSSTYQLVNDSTIYIGNISRTRVGHADYMIDYEDRMLKFLTNNNLTYMVQKNFLVLRNSNSEELHLKLN